MTAEFFYQDNAGITGWFITRAKAAQLLAEHADGCALTGDLESGFSYTPTCVLVEVPQRSIGLFPVKVTPVGDVEELAPRLRARLEADTRGAS